MHYIFNLLNNVWIIHQYHSVVGMIKSNYQISIQTILTIKNIIRHSMKLCLIFIINDLHLILPFNLHYFQLFLLFILHMLTLLLEFLIDIVQKLNGILGIWSVSYVHIPHLVVLSLTKVINSIVKYDWLNFQFQS